MPDRGCLYDQFLIKTLGPECLMSFPQCLMGNISQVLLKLIALGIKCVTPVRKVFGSFHLIPWHIYTLNSACWPLPC